MPRPPACRWRGLRPARARPALVHIGGSAPFGSRPNDIRPGCSRHPSTREPGALAGTQRYAACRPGRSRRRTSARPIRELPGAAARELPKAGEPQHRRDQADKFSTPHFLSRRRCRGGSTCRTPLEVPGFRTIFVRSSGHRSYGAPGELGTIAAVKQPTERPMPQPNDLSRSLLPLWTQDCTLIAVIEMCQSSRPGRRARSRASERQPLKKLAAGRRRALLGLLQRWRDEASQEPGGR